MGRIGVRWPAGASVVEYLRGRDGVELEGIYTHLSSAESDPAYTRSQLKTFKTAVDALDFKGIKHAANSAGALRFPESRWDMTRPGLAIYGLVDGFEPVLAWKTKIVFSKVVSAGSSIGYGRTFKAKKRTRIATLPVGYGDGFPRLLSNKAHVLIRGVKCPVIGSVTMDMITVDVSRAKGARVGDEALLIGRSGKASLRAQDLANWAQTIGYEIVTGLSARVPRLYRRS